VRAMPAQHVATLVPLAVSIVVILCTIVIHALALGATVGLVRHEQRLGRAGTGFWNTLTLVATTIFIAFVAHLVEIALWATLFIRCGEFAEFGSAFDHSAVNYTTLGYGNVVMTQLAAESAARDGRPARRSRGRCRRTMPAADSPLPSGGDLRSFALRHLGAGHENTMLLKPLCQQPANPKCSRWVSWRRAVGRRSDTGSLGTPANCTSGRPLQLFGHSLITTRCGANLDREKQQAIWVSGFDGSDKSF